MDSSPEGDRDISSWAMESLICAFYTFRVRSTSIRSPCVPHDGELFGATASVICISLAQVLTLSIQTWFFILSLPVIHCLFTLASILHCLPRYGPAGASSQAPKLPSFVFFIGQEALKTRRIGEILKEQAAGKLGVPFSSSLL